MSDNNNNNFKIGKIEYSSGGPISEAAKLNIGPGRLIASIDDAVNDLNSLNKGSLPVGGKKFDGDKPRMELISSIALTELAKVLTFGAKKYSSNNWRAGIAYSRIVGACMRHLNAYNAGEMLDHETGLSHAAHLMCEAMFLLEFEKTHPELNDIYKIEVKK